jgi:hypothetical protein
MCEEWILGLQEWRLLLLAAAYSVLDARDRLKPRKDQRANGIVDSSLISRSEEARTQRTQMQSNVDALMLWASDYMPSIGAASCFQAATYACELSELQREPGICCFTGRDVLKRTTMYGNRNGIRCESTHYVASGNWMDFIQAVMVVGGCREWIDQLVAKYIDRHAIVAPLTMRTVAALVHDRHLDSMRQMLLDARTALVRQLSG